MQIQKTSLLKFISLLSLSLYLISCSNAFHTPVGERSFPAETPPAKQIDSPDQGSDSEQNSPPTLYDLAIAAGINANAVKIAFDFYDKNQDIIKNKEYISILDFNLHSGQKRFFIINTINGKIEKLLTAHGKNSDRNNDGYADAFSNINGSNMSSLGIYLTAETYTGKYGLSMRLDGLQENLNSNARERAIVVHGADYVTPERSQMGRSFGCPALEKSLTTNVVNRIKNQSLFFIYHDSLL